MIDELREYKRNLAKIVKHRFYQRFPLLDPDYPVRKGKVNFIFIHINKTAGSSIAQAIGLPHKKHLSAKRVIQIVGKKRWNESYKFTFVRNPWDRVVSHYQFRLKSNQTKLQDNPLSFTEWVKVTYGDNKDSSYYDKPVMFRPQNEWLLNDQNEIDIDLIGKFENLVSDFAIIADKIGCDPHLPKINRTKKVDYKQFYNAETKEIVAKWFQKDLELFDYKF
ncbi:MAG TPA: sulfotransferase family 2 domain-containing protein [Xenococcaceae cyanobacterium]